MNKLENLKLMELLCSKVCHDLISPASAIKNGLEFLDPDEMESFRTSFDLVRISVDQVLERLTFFRLMLGTGGGNDYFTWNEVSSALRSHLDCRGIKFQASLTDLNDNQVLPRHAAKAQMFAVLVMGDCLPRGGTIQLLNSNCVTLEGIRIIAHGEQCRLREDVKSGLDTQISMADLTVRNVIAYMAVTFFDYLGKDLQLIQNSDREMELTTA